MIFSFKKDILIPRKINLLKSGITLKVKKIKKSYYCALIVFTVILCTLFGTSYPNFQEFPIGVNSIQVEVNKNIDEYDWSNGGLYPTRSLKESTYPETKDEIGVQDGSFFPNYSPAKLSTKDKKQSTSSIEEMEKIYKKYEKLQKENTKRTIHSFKK